LSDHAQEDYLKGDMEKLSSFLMDGESTDSLLVVGKSIGTIAQVFLNDLLTLEGVRNIWLTPVLTVPAVLDGIMKRQSRSLVITGEIGISE